MAEEFPVAWGRSVLEPARGHIREVRDCNPVGMALCGALLIDDLDPEIADGEFAKCSVCLQRLDEITG